MVIALMALLATITISYYGNTVGNMNLDDAANAIIYDVRNAQAKAMNGADGNKWGTCFRNPTSGYDIYEIVSPPGVTACSGATIISTFFLPNAVVFSAPSDSNTTSVIFDKITGTTSADSTMTLAYKGQTRNIIITSSGKIY